MKKLFIISILLLSAGCQFAPAPKQSGTSPTPPVACTQEAKACPDGSYVARSGPNCEFAACPTPPKTTSTPPASPAFLNSGITGTVTIGPTCPVQRIPPDPNCEDRPYQATIEIRTTDGANHQITNFTSGVDGKFTVNLPPGSYLLVPVSTKSLPRGSSQTVTVEKNKYTQVTITYDSGIR